MHLHRVGSSCSDSPEVEIKESRFSWQSKITNDIEVRSMVAELTSVRGLHNRTRVT